MKLRLNRINVSDVRTQEWCVVTSRPGGPQWLTRLEYFNDATGQWEEVPIVLNQVSGI